MEPTMQLPTPAPPDAFSLDDTDSPKQAHVAKQHVAIRPGHLQAADDATPAFSQRHQATSSGAPCSAPAEQEPPQATSQQLMHQARRQDANGSGPGPHSSAQPNKQGDPPGCPPCPAAPREQQQQQQQMTSVAHEQTPTPSRPALHPDQQLPSPAHQAIHAQHTHGPAHPHPAGQPPPQHASSTPAGPQHRQLQENAPMPAQAQQSDHQEQPQLPQDGVQGSRVQPQDLAGVVAQLSDNAEAITAAEDVLRELVSRQAALHQLGRKLEQRQVLLALQQPHLGFSRGRPVAAVMLYRCLQQWGLLAHTPPCPFLEQLAAVLQDQLVLDDASAPAQVAGLQCHVADSLTLCAVLYCVLLKAVHPALAAAAAAAAAQASRGSHSRPGHLPASAAEVVAAARKRVSATWQQGVAHVGPGLQALGKLKLGGWGFKRADDTQQQQQPPAAASAAGSASSLGSGHSSSHPPAPFTPQHAGTQQQQQQQQQQQGLEISGVEQQAPAAAGVGSSGMSPSPPPRPAAAAAGEGLQGGLPLDAFLLVLDQLVQHAYVLLRDQLKRRLTPLLADCVSPENNIIMMVSDGRDEAAEGGAQHGQGVQEGAAGAVGGEPLSPSAAAGSAVGGSAAASPAHAEAALMSYRSWSELVGVLHAALVALRAAHLPRALRAALMQQVLEFVNCQLFNQLLLRPECCSISNARYALRGLKQLDTWIIAEQSATQHSTAHTQRHTASPGSIHSSSTANTRPTPAHTQQAAQGGDTDTLLNTTSSSSSQQAPPQQPAAATGAAAAAAAVHPTAAVRPGADEDDSEWQQVPADNGEFDVWQPAREQQAAPQPWWAAFRAAGGQQQQQQQEKGAAEQPELGPEAWNALSHIRQALQFLVFDDKGALSLDDLTDHVCPALNHQQLYRLCTTAWSEEDQHTADGGVGGVSGEVLEQMQQQYTLSGNGGLIVTFLLDEPTGPLPFVQPPAAAAAAAAARCRLSAVVGWDDGRDYGAGLRQLPAALVDEGCPDQVFGFLTVDQPWPPGRRAS